MPFFRQKSPDIRPGLVRQTSSYAPVVEEPSGLNVPSMFTQEQRATADKVAQSRLPVVSPDPSDWQRAQSSVRATSPLSPIGAFPASSQTTFQNPAAPGAARATGAFNAIAAPGTSPARSTGAFASLGSVPPGAVNFASAPSVVAGLSRSRTEPNPAFAAPGPNPTGNQPRFATGAMAAVGSQLPPFPDSANRTGGFAAVPLGASMSTNRSAQIPAQEVGLGLRASGGFAAIQSEVPSLSPRRERAVSGSLPLVSARELMPTPIVAHKTISPEAIREDAAPREVVSFFGGASPSQLRRTSGGYAAVADLSSDPVDPTAFDAAPRSSIRVPNTPPAGMPASMQPMGPTRIARATAEVKRPHNTQPMQAVSQAPVTPLPMPSLPELPPFAAIAPAATERVVTSVPVLRRG